MLFVVIVSKNVIVFCLGVFSGNNIYFSDMGIINYFDIMMDFSGVDMLIILGGVVYCEYVFVGVVGIKYFILMSDLDGVVVIFVIEFDMIVFLGI